MPTIRHHLSKLYQLHERHTRPLMVAFNWLVVGAIILFLGYLFLQVY